MVTTPETIATALDELAGRDKDIARTLAEFGYPEPRVREPGFGTLLNIIIGQQISVQSAAAIRGRLRDVAHPLTPGSFLVLDDDVLRWVGFSHRKLEYGRLLAERGSAAGAGRFIYCSRWAGLILGPLTISRCRWLCNTLRDWIGARIGRSWTSSQSPGGPIAVPQLY